MSSSKRKEKTTLNNQQRKDIITYKEKNPNISHVDLVSWVKKNMGLDIHPSTIGHLIKNKDNVEDNLSAKRQKTVQYPDLKNALLEWILQNQDQIILSDDIIIEKAKYYAQLLKISDCSLKFSHGWLFKFKKRHSLNQITKHGEDASVDDTVIAVAIPKLREILEPDTMLATKSLKGKKKNKEQLTVALCVNADRTDKIKPFMNTILFQQWLKDFDLKMAGHKIILLIDGAKCHSFSNLNLKNTTVHHLPPNTTSRLQPLDAGIIMSFKRRYKTRNDDKMNVLTAIRFIAKAWREVSSETVFNCFRHTGILPVDLNEEEGDEVLDDDNIELMKELRENIEALQFRNVMDLEEYIDHPEEKEIYGVLSDQEIVNLVTNPEPEKDKSDEDDDSTEMCQVTHNEALNTIDSLEQYLLQQDLWDTTRSKHEEALSNLQE
ncbi:14182_t:CDS:2, partial [Cetraspora pellucida]